MKHYMIIGLSAMSATALGMSSDETQARAERVGAYAREYSLTPEMRRTERLQEEAAARKEKIQGLTPQYRTRGEKAIERAQAERAARAERTGAYGQGYAQGLLRQAPPRIQPSQEVEPISIIQERQLREEESKAEMERSIGLESGYPGGRYYERTKALEHEQAEQLNTVLKGWEREFALMEEYEPEEAKRLKRLGERTESEVARFTAERQGLLREAPEFVRPVQEVTPISEEEKKRLKEEEFEARVAKAVGMETGYPGGKYYPTPEELAEQAETQRLLTGFERKKAYIKEYEPEYARELGWLPREKNLIRQTLDYISDTSKRMGKNINAQARASLNKANEFFSKALREAGKGTTAAADKMRSYIASGLDALRAFKMQIQEGGQAAWGRVSALTQRPQVMAGDQGTQVAQNQLARDYERLTKEYKQLQRQGASAEEKKKIIYNLEELRDRLIANPELKEAVTKREVAYLIRKWKGENVLVDYIGGYITKLQAMPARPSLAALD